MTRELKKPVHATNALNQRKGSTDEPHPSPLLGTSSLQVPALLLCQHATSHAGSSRRRIHRPSKPKAVALNCNDTDSGVVSDALQHLRRRLRAELAQSRSTCSTLSIGSAETVGAIFPSLRQKQVKTLGDALYSQSQVRMPSLT